MTVVDSLAPAPARGLTAADAAARLAERGPNEIRREAGTPVWRILARQFASPMIGLLAVAAVVAFVLGETVDAVAIVVIVALNGLVGFFQEHRAENAVLALRAMTAPRARVLRDGHAVVLPAREIVVGDLLLLEAGDLVAADARLVEAHALAVTEAALTGESMPVQKDPRPLSDATPLADRTDRVHSGTAVVAGTGLAEVYATGMGTELGHIAHLIESAQEQVTPLQARLEGVSRTLIKLCLAVVALVAVLGFARGHTWLEVLLSAVSLAVAAVPEGLPAVVTIALAVGVQRMAARNVLVRRLPAVETLGSATVVCTDKTGTLTTGRMTVRELWGEDHHALLYAAAANNDADLAVASGDPTELALLEAAHERGIEREDIERERPRVKTNPFDSERKRMSIRRSDGVLYVKGAPDLTIPLCTDGATGSLEANAEMAERGLRVLAVATGTGDTEAGLTLLGLVGIADPPRTEAIEAVAHARAAGITTVMITGDHPATARAIARELGILLVGEPADERVHARVTPEEKLHIVRRWKAKGEIVAMTGDGVNDAPALREAHIGIAMGKAGTEVSREAADMVLADDNFASIIAAVREGRGIFDNIQKTLVYLLSGNAAELLVMLGAAIVGLPLPLLPVQLLWINLVTDGLPALALVVDPVDADVLTRPPRKPEEPMLGRSEWATVVFTGLLQAGVALGVFAWVLREEGLGEAQNMAFTTLVFGELFRAFAARSPTKLFWEVGAFSNLRLLGVVVLSVALQLALHHVPVAQEIFRLTPLSLADCLLSLALGLVPVTVLELAKLYRRGMSRLKA
ncbi:MAG: cation-translocating P-type ATPase [Pseudomonadota bacterium]|nr:cation-translocating P-type ATPase [Pseudomonadota bacterium]